MELFKSLETKTKNFNDPFQHFEINEPLTEEAIKEISNAEIADPRNANLKYDGTRALDGGDGAFRSGIKDGGKAKKLRCYVTKPILKSNKNMIAVMKRHILPEHPQENKIIKI